MKKAYLLFPFLFTAFVMSVSAQNTAIDSPKKQVLAVNDTAKVFLKPLITNSDSIKQQYILTANDSLQTNQVKLPVDMNVPLLVSGESLKHHTTDKPADMNLGGASSLFSPVTDKDLQNSIVKDVEIDLKHAEGQFTAVAIDTLRSAIPQKMPSTISNLKQKIPLISNDSLRAAYYQKIADHYLNYDSITIRKTKQLYQEAAIEFTLKALHSYSRGVDGYGIMKSYINLSKVYNDQKKYSQAKWFILQANTRARNLFDVPYTISTLLSLADIKMAIKDYALAKRDLDEALTLSIQNHLTKQEALVQQNFGVLYVYLNEPKKATAALKRHDMIEDSIIKAADAKRLAMISEQDYIQQSKKKADTSIGKKVIKTNSYKRIASL